MPLPLFSANSVVIPWTSDASFGIEKPSGFINVSFDNINVPFESYNKYANCTNLGQLLKAVRGVFQSFGTPVVSVSKNK